MSKKRARRRRQVGGESANMGLLRFTINNHIQKLFKLKLGLATEEALTENDKQEYITLRIKDIEEKQTSDIIIPIMLELNTETLNEKKKAISDEIIRMRNQGIWRYSYESRLVRITKDGINGSMYYGPEGQRTKGVPVFRHINPLYLTTMTDEHISRIYNEYLFYTTINQLSNFIKGPTQDGPTLDNILTLFNTWYSKATGDGNSLIKEQWGAYEAEFKEKLNDPVFCKPYTFLGGCQDLKNWISFLQANKKTITQKDLLRQLIDILTNEDKKKALKAAAGI